MTKDDIKEAEEKFELKIKGLEESIGSTGLERRDSRLMKNVLEAGLKSFHYMLDINPAIVDYFEEKLHKSAESAEGLFSGYATEEEIAHILKAIDDEKLNYAQGHLVQVKKREVILHGDPAENAINYGIQLRDRFMTVAIYFWFIYLVCSSLTTNFSI
jgi:hypothetical protein